MRVNKSMKMQSANKWRLLFLSSAFLISACTPQPPDVAVFEYLKQRTYTDQKTGHLMLKPDPVCMKEIGEPECGHGVYIISKKQIFVGDKSHLFNNKKWSDLIPEMVLVPAQESYAPLLQYIINSCEKMNCNDQVDRFKVQLDELKAVGNTSGVTGG